MRAVVCHHAELSVQEIPRPEPGPGQILIRVLRAGICGSDLHARVHADVLSQVAGEMGYDQVMAPDSSVVFGHEVVGEVVSYGPHTRARWAPGAMVTALPVRRDHGTAHMIGFEPGAPGAYAEYTIVQEAFTFAVPESLGVDQAAFTEPLAVAWHAVRRAEVAKGRPAIVIGCGPIGLAVIVMLKAAGVRTVVASDLSPARRALATRCGADVVVDPRVDSPWTAFRAKRQVASPAAYANFGIGALGKVRRIPLVPWQKLMLHADRLGQSPAGPVVFECVGVSSMIEQTITAAPLRTRVVVVGVCMEADIFRPAVAVQKEIDLRFVFGYDPAEFLQTLQMLAAGTVDPTPLHTGTVGLDGVAQAFTDLANPEVHAKILIDPTLSPQQQP